MSSQRPWSARPCIRLNGVEARGDLSKLVLYRRQFASHVWLDCVGRWWPACHLGARAGYPLDESLIDKKLDGLPHSRATDSMLFGQVSLSGQPGSRRKSPVNDLICQQIRELLSLRRWSRHWVLTVPSWSVYGSAMALPWYRIGPAKNWTSREQFWAAVQAQRDLDAYQSPGRETERFLHLNDRVCDAERPLNWLQRGGVLRLTLLRIGGRR